LFQIIFKGFYHIPIAVTAWKNHYAKFHLL
jgi:hypothetical protein